ncbi:MAG TPA: hypothetical protein VII06_34185 [Chloroflexota bacterium]
MERPREGIASLCQLVSELCCPESLPSLFHSVHCDRQFITNGSQSCYRRAFVDFAR